ncbi:hypothetical protein N0V93_002898 [Gnomoniopsis smithogilvyi]|uniref:SNF2 N-terminal domain-containing protein n=1 Tax=Gnomoniopsis smithogilvyi TaxID=1191159 RepID=A0A9W8YXJ2_9PEZI|nr:hypothetical protein N0V93_002898 [Gnomoniopsis smithogilvyi]
MLASILYSADKALDDAYFDPAVSDPDSGPILTKATLVVVPSVQLMENWESEILRHFSDDALQHLRFHGSSRPRTVEALKAPDVILTTYATLAADHDGPGLLYNMEWYRVVLDEGTPIQNAMEDLASLAQFLQLAPLCSKDAFDTYVLRPLSEPVTNSKPLRAFMEAYCLRRTESCLSLPLSREEVVPLHLSLPERSAYDNVLRIARNKIDDAVSSGQNIVFSYWKSTLRILATLLQGAGVECVQVDGNTSFADRSTRLRSFKQDQSTSVLLMTVGVGAVGQVDFYTFVKSLC